MAPPEIREIPGFPGYGASADGRIWTRRHHGGHGLYPDWREKAHTGNGTGYRRVNLGNGDGTVAMRYVHRLVAAIFVPNPEGLPQVNHRNGDKADNQATNLEWTTPAGNQNHALDAGLAKSGERHCQARLTDAQVREIRSRAGEGYGAVSRMSREYGVSRRVIKMILDNQTWTRVGDAQ